MFNLEHNFLFFYFEQNSIFKYFFIMKIDVNDIDASIQYLSYHYETWEHLFSSCVGQ